MTPEATTYRLLDGDGLLAAHDDERVRLRPGEPERRPAGRAPAGDLPLAA
jgi:hypothetical protein